MRLPVWVADKPLPQKVPKTETLRPFKDEEELRQVISFCHDLILEKLGHDPAKAFDEMTKLLFLKVYDEREVPNFYEFVVLANEKPHDVADRVRELFDKAISSSKYQDVFWSQFNTVPVPVTLELDDFSIFNIVQVLQGYVKQAIKYFAEHKSFGIDINDRMVRVAKMNMIMHGDGHAGIFHILRGGGVTNRP